MTDLITTTVNPPEQGAVDFTIDPVSLSPITFVVGGDVYASDVHSVEINEAITFEAVTDIPDPVGFEWDFGDGLKNHGSAIVHTFVMPNPHQKVTLRVTDSKGHIYSCVKQIYLEDGSVSPPTAPRF
jgi:hypothetical protein